jgi:hypothetical protein
MLTTELLTPVLEGGIQNTNFFNGRLLTAEDLRTEQQASQQRHQRLGQAIGEGIVYGLQVRKTTDITSPPEIRKALVRVSAGLALNRKGQTLYLPQDVNVALVCEECEVPTGSGVFAVCQPPQAVPTGTGVYILVLSPAAGLQGLTRASGLGGNGRTAPCRSRYEVEGVQFGLAELDVSKMTEVSEDTRKEIADLMAAHENPANLSKLRNWLAHLCFGTEERGRFPRDPFARAKGDSAFLQYGVVDHLRPPDPLSDCGVPLALIFWTRDGIIFVDVWSVRRRVMARPPSSFWPVPVSERPMAEAEATFLQFQAHVAELTKPEVPQSRLSTIRAVDHFRYLPAVGIIPFTGLRASRGFDTAHFFPDLTYRDPVHIEGAKLHSLSQDSFSYPPIDLEAPIDPESGKPESREMIWLYLVRENMQAVRESTTGPPQPYVIFTNGHMPYRDDAQFDLARWDYSNYGLGVAGRFG